MRVRHRRVIGWGGVLGTAGSLVKLAAAGVDVVRVKQHGVTVLLYHRIGGGSGLSVDLPTSLYEAHIAELTAEERVVSLDKALDLLASPVHPPRDYVVLTFDDGTGDFVENAVPVLERYGVPATIYLATDFIERRRPFPFGGAPLSWSAIADVLWTGLITVGSHTHTHALLDRVDTATIVQELDWSIKLIQDRLGVTPEHFAYPKGLSPRNVPPEITSRFRSTAIAGTRPNPYGATDPYRLFRSPIQSTDGLRWFRQKAAGGMKLEDDLRRLWNLKRYRRVVQ